MSEQKQNGEQQPSVENGTEVIYHEYIVCDKLEKIEDKLHYKLSLKTLKQHKFLYIEVSKIVLAPNMIISISSDNLNDGDLLDIEAFDEYTCSRLKEKHKVCLYKISRFQILFPEEVKELNYLYSGVVMKNMDSVVDIDRKFFLYKSYAAKVYEVKLDSKITINSINRVFKKIYLYSDDGLFNGFKVKNLKIDPISLFNCNHTLIVDKPKLRAKYARKEDVLSEDDKTLLKKASFYKIITKSIKYFSLFFIWIVVGLSIITTSSYFKINLESTIYLFIAILFYLGLSEKVDTLYYLKFIKKDDVYKVFKYGSIVGSIISFLFIFFFMYLYSALYMYNTDYAYDSVKKKFLDDSKFFVDTSLIFRTDKILKRYIPIKSNYSFDLLVNNPNELPTFTKRYIDLKVIIDLKKGKYLLDPDLVKIISSIQVLFTNNINKSLYGDIYSMNKYEYEKALVEIKEDINYVLDGTLDIDYNSSVVSNINILTKYAKLQIVN